MTTVSEFLAPKFGTLSLGDIATKGKARIAPLSVKGKAVKLILSQTPTLKTPWQVSSYDGGDRCSLDLVLDDSLEKVCDKIDQAVLAAVSASPERFFKNPPKDVESWYRPIKKAPSKEGYASTMRTKLTLPQDSAKKCSFRAWDEQKQPLSTEQLTEVDWPRASLGVMVRIVGVYFQAQSFGPMLEVENLLIKAEDTSCPFASDDPFCLED